MTRLELLIIVVALGLAFVAYKYPAAYRVMFIFTLPVLAMAGFLVLAIKVGDLNGSIKSIYHELPNIRTDPLRSVALPNKKIVPSWPIS